MVIAYFCRYRSFGKIFRICGIAARVVVTNSGDRKFSGLSADNGGFNGIGNGESYILGTL